MTHELLALSRPEWAQRTDIVRYAERQAQSCQYLERVFGEIHRRTERLEPGLKNDLAELFFYLLGIHRRQYKDLESVTFIPQDPDRRSYYFDTIYKSFGLSPAQLPKEISKEDLLSILAIQVVSYMRGRDRYDILRSYEGESNRKFIPVWSKFFLDAAGNTKKVLSFMDKHYSLVDLKERMDLVLIAEDKMMKDIWCRVGII